MADPSAKGRKLIVRQEEPLNAGPSLDALRQRYLTPNHLFFVRNHGSIPHVDPTAFRLTVTGMVEKPLTLSLDELREAFPTETRAATLQCAGNRRREMAEVTPIPGELLWEADAISNASWGGVRLAEVLGAAGVQADAQHVAFSGLDEVEREGRSFGFGGSIPLEKALSAEVLLAYEMNGVDLPPEHGFPLRVVVPGYIGARSVKWLSEISVQMEPSHNFFQRSAYRLFPPEVRADTAEWDQGEMLGDLSVNAVIWKPSEGETLSAGEILIQGYAVTGAGHRVERVEISVDGGRNWVAARLGEDDDPWTWRFWAADLRLEPGPVEIIARGWDSGSNSQPEDARSVWNFKGYMNNSWHRVRAKVA